MYVKLFLRGPDSPLIAKVKELHVFEKVMLAGSPSHGSHRVVVVEPSVVVVVVDVDVVVLVVVVVVVVVVIVVVEHASSSSNARLKVSRFSPSSAGLSFFSMVM